MWGWLGTLPESVSPQGFGRSKVMRRALFSLLLQVGALACCAVPVIGHFVQRWEPGSPVVVSDEEAAQVYGGCDSQTNNWFTATTCATSQQDSCHQSGQHPCGNTNYSCGFKCSQTQNFANSVEGGAIGFNTGVLQCNSMTRAPCEEIPIVNNCFCDTSATPINAPCSSYTGQYGCGS